MTNLMDSFSFWKDVFAGKYKNLKPSYFYAVYVKSFPMSKPYNKECDDVLEKILENYDQIKCVEYYRNKDEFRIKYEDGRYVKFSVYLKLSFFLENMLFFDNSDKLVYDLWGFRPSRRMMLKFLDKFHEFVCIRNGKIVVTDPNMKVNIKNFFDFNGEKNESEG